MKILFTSLFIISVLFCQAQFRSSVDTTRGRVAVQRPMNKSIYMGAGENIVLATSNLVLTSMEREITSLESRETQALKKRDFVALTVLWERDFSGDDTSTDQVVNSSNSLPYYAVLSRIIDNVYTTDSTAFTRGKEQFQLLDGGSKITDVQERKFSHIWSKRNGVWKLTSKINSND